MPLVPTIVMCDIPKIYGYFSNFMHIVVRPISVSKFKQFNKYRRIDKYHYTDKYCESRSTESGSECIRPYIVAVHISL